MLYVTVKIDLGDVPRRYYGEAVQETEDKLREYAAIRTKQTGKGRHRYDLEVEGDGLPECWDLADNIFSDVIPSLSHLGSVEAMPTSRADACTRCASSHRSESATALPSDPTGTFHPCTNERTR